MVMLIISELPIQMLYLIPSHRRTLDGLQGYHNRNLLGSICCTPYLHCTKRLGSLDIKVVLLGEDGVR